MYRYNKKVNHKSWNVITQLQEPDIEDKGLTPFYQAMPLKYKREDAVLAYRLYYVHEKSRFAKWKKGNEPEWYIKMMEQEDVQVLSEDDEVALPTAQEKEDMIIGVETRKMRLIREQLESIKRKPDKPLPIKKRKQTYKQMANFTELFTSLQQQDQLIAGLPTLSPSEQQVDQKLKELKQQFWQQYQMDQMIAFWDLRDNVGQTELYKFLDIVPKGAVLHHHIIAGPRIRQLLDILAQDDLVRYNPTSVLFSYKEQEGFERFQDWLQHNDISVVANQLEINKEDDTGHSNQIWKRFQHIFNSLLPVILCEKMMRQYYPHVLQDLYDQNVQRIEIRHVFGLFHDGSGNLLPAEEDVRVWKEISDEFISTHPGFSVGMIVCGIKAFDYQQIQLDVTRTYNFIKAYPDFVIGYDLVGEEETLQPNEVYRQIFLDIKQQALQENVDLHFIFHAGEHLVNSSISTLYEALALGTKRLGHAIALRYHPALMNYVRENRITVECNPISNFILGYVKDLRQHPGLQYLNHGIPISISPDDPGYFGYDGVTLDWLWITLCWDLNLAQIKKLCENSCDGALKAGNLKEIWLSRWEAFISANSANQEQAQQYLNLHNQCQSSNPVLYASIQIKDSNLFEMISIYPNFNFKYQNTKWFKIVICT